MIQMRRNPEVWPSRYGSKLSRASLDHGSRDVSIATLSEQTFKQVQINRVVPIKLVLATQHYYPLRLNLFPLPRKRSHLQIWSET